MSLVGLDLNASRARAVAGPAARKLSLVRLDADQVELPLALSLEHTPPQVGRAGFALSRARSHLACLDFLPYLGGGRVWSSGTVQVDADRALTHTFVALGQMLGRPAGLAFTLPAYLDESQLQQVYRLAQPAGLPLLGSMPAPLAAVLASPVAAPGGDSGLVLVVDADGYALTWSVVERGSGQLRLRLVQPSTQLGRGVWLRRLLDGVANRCVRQSRRDPRESAETEQALYEQLVYVLDQGPSRMVQMQIQGAGWYFHLMLHADEVAALVTPLLRQVVADLESILATIDTLGQLNGVVITHTAAGLPGLVATLRARLRAQEWPRLVHADEEGDYGDQLLNAAGAPDLVHVLHADVLPCTAHDLAVRIHRGDFPRGHLDTVVLPDAPVSGVIDTGPARLTFRGREHVLSGGAFSLGRDPACDLVFESELYPHVSARHCEIVFDRRAFVLWDRSRHGTLLNDRPVPEQAALHSGDWIRLGPRGPVLRFLGTNPPGDGRQASPSPMR